jgi:hypothetical protein
MARLVNVKSGAIVNVADEKVARLGSEWEPAEKPKPKQAAKPATKKS